MKKEPEQVKALDELLKQQNPVDNASWTGVAYYFLDEEKEYVPNSVTKNVCFAGIIANFHSRPSAKYIVYVPVLRNTPKDVCLAYLKDLVGKYHFFKEVIEDFDSEKIYETRRVVIDGTKWSYFHFLTVTTLIRYMDEYPHVVQEWYKKVVVEKKRNTWNRFYRCHIPGGVTEKNPYGLTWNHAIFQPRDGCSAKKEPAIHRSDAAKKSMKESRESFANIQGVFGE